jgi:hypothetical protein
MNNKIFISFRTYERMANCSGEAFAVYFALKSYYNQQAEGLEISASGIYHRLTNCYPNAKHQTRDLEPIVKGIQELHEAGLIKILDNFKSDFYIDVSNLYEDNKVDVETEGIFDPSEKVSETVDNFYTDFTLEQIQGLYKEYKGAILKYLMYLLDRKAMNNDYLWFSDSREAIAEGFGMNVKTVDKYNEALVKNHVIYIHFFNYRYTKTSQTVANVYGLYKDKEAIESSCKTFIKEKLEANEIYQYRVGKSPKKPKKSVENRGIKSPKANARETKKKTMIKNDTETEDVVYMTKDKLQAILFDDDLEVESLGDGDPYYTYKGAKVVLVHPAIKIEAQEVNPFA